MNDEKYKGYYIKIHYDACAESPREWGNIGTIACFHNRYEIGDKHNLSTDEIIEIVKRKDVLSLPIYLYDHSGITINTAPFACKWDSMQIGYIYVDKERLKKERLDKCEDKEIYKYLNSEVKTYDNYLRGEVYYYNIIAKTKCNVCEHVEEEIVDSCSGYYEYDACLEDAKIQIDYILKTGGNSD
jgi:hypothetical protein